MLIRNLIFVGVFRFWVRKDSHATKTSCAEEINVTYLAEFGLDFTVKFAEVSVCLTVLDSSYWSSPLSSKKGKEEG